MDRNSPLETQVEETSQDAKFILELLLVDGIIEALWYLLPLLLWQSSSAIS
jgi:hypothetical protein